MFPTIRRIALAVAGAAALIAAGRARADDRFQDYPSSPLPAQGYRAAPYQAPAPALRFSLVLPAPPAWLGIVPPPPPAYGAWTRLELERQVRWLDMARASFYRYGAGDGRRVRQFDAWYQARHAELDRCRPASAWAPAPGYEWHDGWRAPGYAWHDGWRGPGGRGRGGESWERGRWGHERRERD